MAWVRCCGGGTKLKTTIDIIDSNGVLQIPNVYAGGESVAVTGYMRVNGAGYYTEAINTEDCDRLLVTGYNGGLGGPRQFGYRLLSDPNTFIPVYSVSNDQNVHTFTVTVPKNTLIQIGWDTPNVLYIKQCLLFKA